MNPKDQARGAFDVGVGFPASYVQVHYDPTTDPNLGGGGNIIDDMIALTCLLFPLTFIAIIIGGMISAVRSAAKRREDYFDPKLSVVGAGPRRDLTAVEAAIIMERPLEDVATMVLFGLIRKGKVKVLSESLPMRLQKLSETGEHAYENAYLGAIRPDGTMDRNMLRICLVDLIKATSKKVEGFDFNATQNYYRTIVETAWRQVIDSKTPEEIASVLNERNDWMMIDNDYEGRMRRTVFPLPVLIGHTSAPGSGTASGPRTTSGSQVPASRRAAATSPRTMSAR